MREAGVIGGGSTMTGTHGTGHQGKIQHSYWPGGSLAWLLFCCCTHATWGRQARTHNLYSEHSM
jgi:hypothetical protein